MHAEILSWLIITQRLWKEGPVFKCKQNVDSDKKNVAFSPLEHRFLTASVVHLNTLILAILGSVCANIWTVVSDERARVSIHEHTYA